MRIHQDIFMDLHVFVDVHVDMPWISGNGTIRRNVFFETYAKQLIHVSQIYVGVDPIAAVHGSETQVFNFTKSFSEYCWIAWCCFRRKYHRANSEAIYEGASTHYFLMHGLGDV